MYVTHHKLVLTFFLLAGTSQTMAMFMRPTAVPIERIVANIQTYIDQHPDDARAYYQLARANYLAFVNRSFLVPQSQEFEGLPVLAKDHLIHDWIGSERHREAMRRAQQATSIDDVSALDGPARTKFYDQLYEIEQQLEADLWQPERPQPEDALQRAAQALAAFDKALQLQPKDALSHLGRASLLEQVCQFQQKHPQTPLPKSLAGADLKSACAAYLKAYELAIDEDLELEMRPLGGLQEVVSHEAGQAFVRLCNDADPALKRQVDAHVKTLAKLRVGMITPLVVSLARVQSFSELLSGNTVRFDLDADGRAEAWQWLTPQAGLLVWQPDGVGNSRRPIRSGSQLFGNFSFDLLWENGFDALQVLDDDANGWISGHELTGIAVWFDENSDGRCDAHEVRRLHELGIVRFATRAPQSATGLLVNPHGMQLADGTALPLWDWLAEPAVCP
jgi:tetratricopeptide (TPR) repeat protein